MRKSRSTDDCLRNADADLERYRADLAQDRKALREAIEAVYTAKRDLEGIRKPSLDEEQVRQRRKLIREANMRLFQKESTCKRLSELQEQLDALVRHASPGLWRNNQKAIAVSGILFGLALLVGGTIYGETALLLDCHSGLDGHRQGRISVLNSIIS